MALLQYSVAVRNVQNDQLESTIGASAILQIRTGAQPANCAAGDSGSLLCEITLPSDWLTASVNGLKQKNGTWSDNASAGGIAGHFRIKDPTGTTCHIQGDVTATGGGGKMTLDNVNIGSGQIVTVTTFDLTRGNA